MSGIDELIKELDPEGVQFIPLGKIAQLVRGNGMPKSELTSEGVGAIHYGQIYKRYGVWTTNTISFVTPETAAKLAKAEPGDIIITNTSENIEDVGKAVAWLGNEPIVTGGHATVIKHHQDPKYLSYWFQSDSFFMQKKALATGTKVIDVSAKQLMKVLVPLPPLRVQREIVRILDQFTELEAKLEAELETRRRQYNYYLASLMAFSERADVPWVPMGEVGEFVRGRRFVKDDFVDLGTPCIHYGEIYTFYGTAATSTLTHVRNDMVSQLRFARQNDVIIAAVGETVEDVGKAVAWLGSEDIAIHDDCFLYRHRLDPKFISYYLQTDAFHSQKRKHVSRAKVKRLSRDGLSRITIPIPAMEEQRRIVGMLEPFDVLINDLGVGLPAELAARRKQYEYYRDQLLTFEKAVV